MKNNNWTTEDIPNQKGKTAIVTGRFKAEIIGEGKNYSFAERYTAVFVKRGGRWQLVAEQSTEIAEK